MERPFSGEEPVGQNNPGHRKLQAVKSGSKPQKTKAMKKVVLFSILGIILFGEVTFAAVTLARNPSPTDVWIKFVLIFHKPRTQCTSGFGICFDVLFGGDLIDAPMGAKGCPVRGQINNLNELVVEIAESDLNLSLIHI